MTEFYLDNDIEFIEIKKNKILIDNNTQTEKDDDTQLLNTKNIINDTELLEQNLSEINILKSEIEALKIKNCRLESNFKDICNLLVMFTKIDIKNLEIDKIRRQLTILVNRELRMNYAFPFVNILSNIR